MALFVIVYYLARPLDEGERDWKARERMEGVKEKHREQELSEASLMTMAGLESGDLKRAEA